MKEQFRDYLTSLAMGPPLVDRVASIHEFYAGICPDEIVSIMVTDVVAGDGQRILENLWFFSEAHCMEAKGFAASDNFDITPIKNRVHYVVVLKSDYDFKKADDKSRLHVQFNLDPGTAAIMRAARQNCDYLRDIVKKHIFANLKK